MSPAGLRGRCSGCWRPSYRHGQTPGGLGSAPDAWPDRQNERPGHHARFEPGVSPRRPEPRYGAALPDSRSSWNQEPSRRDSRTLVLASNRLLDWEDWESRCSNSLLTGRKIPSVHYSLNVDRTAPGGFVTLREFSSPSSAMFVEFLAESGSQRVR